MQIIIPMSGQGKRFLESGYETPKPLIEVDGRPMIQHVVDLFPDSDNISFICNDEHLERTPMKKILKRIVPRAKIYEVRKGSARGPVDAVMSMESYIDDKKEVIVSYCDYGTKWDYHKFLRETRKAGASGAIACYRGFHPHMLGSDHYAYVKNVDKKALRVSEKKPFTSNKMGEYASNGTYYFKTGAIMKKYFNQLLESGETIKDEYYVSMTYNAMIEDGMKVTIFEIEKMLQWGTPYDLEIYKSWSSYFSNLKEGMTPPPSPEGTTMVLPMAGRGSRFTVEGFSVPKPLIPIDEKPMVVEAVKCLPTCDRNVFICLSDHLEDYALEKTLRDNFKNTDIHAIDGVTEGQACTTEIGIQRSGLNPEDPILISACDNGVFYDTDRYAELVDDPTNDIIVWSFRNNQTSKINPDMYAWLDVDDEDFIRHVSCKKFIYDDPLTTHAIIGTMFFRKAKYFLDGLRKNYQQNTRSNNEFYVDDVLNRNIEDGLRVKVFEVENFICWGTPDDYRTYEYWKEYFV